MPWPAGLPLITVAGHVDALPAGGGAGMARFLHAYPLLGPTSDSMVPPRWEYATIDAAGDWTIDLPPTNHPSWTPVDWAYQAEVFTSAGVVLGTLQLDYQTLTVQFADLFQPAGAATTGTTYATLAQLALKADSASPALTGTPTAPTAAGGTSTTQLATTAFVTTAVAALTKVLVLGSADPVPGGTAAGTVIVRTT